MSNSPVAYDSTMECLSRLRCAPHGNAIADIARDMSITDDSVSDLLTAIEAKGFGVVRWAEGDKWVAAIAAEDWQKAQRMSSAYIDLREGAEA